MVDERVVRTLRRQHGVVSRRQLLDSGVTSRQIDRLLGHEELVALHLGVYRHALTAMAWEARLMAACLATGGVASHRAALRLHGLTALETGVIEVSVPHGRRVRRTGVLVHQSTQLGLTRLIERDGIPCTPLDRALFDGTSVLSMASLKAVAHEVLRADRLLWRHLYSVLARHSRPGRDGTALFREFLETADPSARVPLSEWSEMVVELLVSFGLSEPVLEYRVVIGPDGAFVQVDIAHPDQKVAIELDSSAWHRSREQFETDRSRIRALAVAGWATLPLTWEQYMPDGAHFAGQVRDVLAARS